MDSVVVSWGTWAHSLSSKREIQMLKVTNWTVRLTPLICVTTLSLNHYKWG